MDRSGQSKDKSARSVAAEMSGETDASAGADISADTDTSLLSEFEEALAGDENAPAQEVDQFPFLSGRLPGQSRLEYLGRRSWALVGIGLAGWGLLEVLTRLGVVLVPVLLSAVIIVLCAPVVAWFQEHGINRIFGTLLCYLVLGTLLTGLVVLIVPAFSSQLRLLAEQTPGYVERSSASLEKLQERLDDSSPQVGDALRQARQSLQNRTADISGQAVGAIFEIVRVVIGFIAALLIAAIVSFIILVDMPQMTEGVSDWLDRPRNRRLAGALHAMQRSSAWFVRGQIITGLATGVLVSFALWVLGVPFYLPLGALAGIFHVVPGIGPIVAGAPAVLIAFISGGWAKAFLVTVVTIVILQAVAYLIAPRILGKVVELSPVTIIVALTFGGALFGIAGVLLAVPAVAAARDGIKWSLYTPAEVEAAYAEGLP